jgi:hypothetical protein
MKLWRKRALIDGTDSFLTRPLLSKSNTIQWQTEVVNGSKRIDSLSNQCSRSPRPLMRLLLRMRLLEERT